MMAIKNVEPGLVQLLYSPTPPSSEKKTKLKERHLHQPYDDDLRQEVGCKLTFSTIHFFVSLRTAAIFSTNGCCF